LNTIKKQVEGIINNNEMMVLQKQPQSKSKVLRKMVLQNLGVKIENWLKML
jgi:hypothetical protein